MKTEASGSAGFAFSPGKFHPSNSFGWTLLSVAGVGVSVRGTPTRLVWHFLQSSAPPEFSSLQDGQITKIDMLFYPSQLKFGTIRNLAKHQLPDVGWNLLFGDYIAQGQKSYMSHPCRR
jgi:hypothetical protein